MAKNKKNEQNTNKGLQPDPNDPKVVETEDRVENNEKQDNKDTRDMGDVVARDSMAQDGVKQSP